MLEQADAALGWLDLDGRLRWANASLLALVGRSSLPAAGVALDIAADDVSRWSTATARAISSATAIQLPFVQMGDGGSPVSVRLTPLEGNDGILVEMAATRMPAAVSVATSMRSLAHELKNPLGGLRGAAQLLSRRVLDADLRAYAEIIVAEVDRLAALTDRFLVPAAQSPATAINLHGVLERVRLLFIAEGRDVQRDYDPSIPDCMGDIDRLVQVVLNLVRNAVEAGADRVILRSRFDGAARLARGRGDALRLDVVDNGTGVPDGLASTLFLPLVSGRDGGTGLGLAMVHEIVIDHGGRIAFASRPGHTVFSLWLPVASGEPA